MRCGNLILYDGNLFPVWADGSVSGSTQRYGIFYCADVTFNYRNRGGQDPMDFCSVSETPDTWIFIYLISGFMAGNDCDAGNLFLFCKKKGT